MDQEALIRRAWLKRGKKTIVKVNRNKEPQSYMGFLNQKNRVCEMFEMPWQNSEEVLKACETSLRQHPDKKIAIVWDNAAFHKSKAIREQLKTGHCKCTASELQRDQAGFRQLRLKQSI
jgi:hypothetical protein